MYEYIIGTIEYISPEYIVVENQGIGYQVITPNPYLFKMDDAKQKVYIYFHVRDDAHTLYGFKTREEKAFFMKLISVSGIGPKGALAILASGTPEHIAKAIEREDEKYLTSFPGVGKKTARQIILDLKGKLQEFLNLPGQDINEGLFEDYNPELEEALLALQSLGYSQKEINKVKAKLEKEKLTTDQYIKLALQHFIS